MESKYLEETIDLEKVTAMVMRQWRIAAICVVAALVLGVIYIMTAVPLYTAYAQVLINTGAQSPTEDTPVYRGIVEDESSVLSKVEIVKSERISELVVDNLDLVNDEDFNADVSSPLSKAIGFVRHLASPSSWYATAEEGDPADLKANAVAQLQGGLSVERVGKTYILEIAYTSPFPELSAKVAKAVSEAYINDQLDSRYEATRRASDWLQKRIAELRQQSLSADMAVQKFREDNGLIVADGQLISDQQLTQLNSQLIIAQADTANAQARYNKVKALIESGDMNTVVSDSLSSDLINNLRTKYLETARREREIATRLGPDHVQVVRLRSQMAEYQRQMFEELGRIADSYQTTFQVAKSRQENLEKEVAQATNRTTKAGNLQVKLRELDQEATTYRTLYQSFLQRYQEAVQQQSFPAVESRIISNPTIPDAPESPKRSVVLALSMFMGLAVGAGIGAFREYRERFFRTGDQVQDELGLEFLGGIPLSEPVKLQVDPRSVNPAVDIIKSTGLANYVIDHPLSTFSETLRSAKLAIDIRSPNAACRVVGMLSSVSGEGKSTVSINLAELLAGQGARVLLIDADLRQPGATRQLASQANKGIIDVLQGSIELESAVVTNKKTKLVFLPAVLKKRIPYSAELLSSPAMEQLLERAKKQFDYIILDLPPIVPVVDARALASRIDSYIYVIEWGRTARNVVRKTLTKHAVIAQKCAGIILNKVDLQKHHLYENFGSNEYFHSKYHQYYINE